MKWYNDGGDQTEGWEELEGVPLDRSQKSVCFSKAGGLECAKLRHLPGNWEQGSLTGMEIFPLLVFFFLRIEE